MYLLWYFSTRIPLRGVTLAVFDFLGVLVDEETELGVLGVSSPEIGVRLPKDVRIGVTDFLDLVIIMGERILTQ